MTDHVSKVVRSAIMRSVKSRNTKPELDVRKAAHQLGLRFRIHRKDLPGTPDVVFPKYKIVVFVHGCFWHRHPHCHHATMPKSHVEFWRNKFRRTQERDESTMKDLRGMGWTPIVIWQCELGDLRSIKALIKKRFSEAGKAIRRPR